MKNILVTGGLGYIGSHTIVELIERGYNPICLDNLSNSKEEVKDKIKIITGKDIIFYKDDVKDSEKLKHILKNEKIDGVIHFAGKKAVGESVEKPLLYYEENVYGMISLLKAMEAEEVRSLIFSSSATVYHKDNSIPYIEGMRTGAVNPYGYTKLFSEIIMEGFQKSNPSFQMLALRYFNPIGAHKSGLIGEDPNGIPNNLMPYITRVAKGTYDKLKVFGDDYETKDGTGVRDYIHVVDLAVGHVKALEYLEKKEGLFDYINLGTGRGYSVLDIVKAFEKVNKVKVNYEIVGRRPGDLAIYYANADKAKKTFEFYCWKRNWRNGKRFLEFWKGK